MGVKGLWTLLEPAARPVRLEALAHKRLAVDASIWLYQLVKAMKDADGNPIEDAHVLGFYRRVCKLLYYGIQPVFVFDGGAPELKRTTIDERQAMRGSHTNDAKRAAHQLLQTQLKLHALDGITGSGTMAQTNMDQTQQNSTYETSPSKKRKRDEYELPQLQSQALATRIENEHDLRMAHPEDLRQVLAVAMRHPESLGGLENISIDTESAEFKSLAPEDQHDLIVTLKARSRQTSHDRLQHMLQSSDNALDFSKQQIELLTKRNTLTQQWLQVTGNAHRITSLSDPSNVTVGRVAGERGREYILARSDQSGGGWTLKLGGAGNGDTVNSEDMHVDSAAFTSLDRETAPAITIQSSDTEDEESVEFENVPPASDHLEALSPHIQSQGQDNAQNHSHGAYDMDMVNCHPNLSNGDSMHVTEEIGAEYAEYPQLSSDDEEEDDDNNMASISSDDAEIDAELMEMYGECESMDLVSPQEQQKHQQRMREQREREERAILEMPAPEFLDTWSQLVTQPILDADPRIYENMQGWLLDASLVGLQECAWRANRQLEKLPDVPISNDYDDDDNSENNGIAGNSTSSNAKLDLEFIQTKVARLSLISNYLSFAQRWRQQHNPSQIGIMAGTTMSAAESTDEQAEVISIASDSGSEDDENFETSQTIYSQALANVKQSDHDKSFADYDNDRLAVPFLNSHDIDRLANEAAADDKRDAIFEKSRELAVAMGPEEKISGAAAARVDAAAKPILHIDSASASGSLSDVSLAEDVVMDATNGITEELAAGDASVTVLDAGRTSEDDDGGDDDSSDGDLDTSNTRRTELLRDEQDEYARFVSKLKTSATGFAESRNTSYHTMRAELEDELLSLRTRVRDTKRNASGIETDMVEDIRMLLTLFGVPYITAPMEAEAQCAALVSSGLVDGMVTDDSDAFLFASSDQTKVYRHFFQKDRYVEMYSSNDIFQDSSLNQRDLVFLACLLGSDYTVGIKGIGPVLAIEALAEFGPSVVNNGAVIDDRADEDVVVEALRVFRSWCDSITGVLPGIQLPEKLVDTSQRRRLAQVIRKSGVPERFPDPRVVHAYFHPQVDSSDVSFEWGFPKLDMLRQFLSGKLGWTTEKTDETLVPLVRKMVDAKDTDSNSRYQTTLDLFAPRAGHAMGAVYEAAGIGHSRRVGAAISSHKKRLLSSRTSAVQK